GVLKRLVSIICLMFIATALSACTTDDRDNASTPLPHETIAAPLTQNQTVGGVRAAITTQLHRSLGISVCYGRATKAIVVSGYEALDILINAGYSPDDNSVIHYYMQQLSLDPTINAVLVKYTVNADSYEYIFVPDSRIDTESVL